MGDENVTAPVEQTAVGQQSQDAQAGSDTQNVVDWSKVDWTKVQIPDNVLKQDKRYQQVVKEATDRRLKLKQLRDEIADDGGTPDKSKVEQAPVTDGSVEGQLAQLNKLLTQVLNTQQTTERSSALNEIRSEYEFDDDVIKAIDRDGKASVEEMQATATVLSKALNKPSRKTSTANPAQDHKAQVEAMKNKINGKNLTHPLDVGIQETKGGGVLDFGR